MSYNMRSGVHCSVTDTITMTIFRRPPCWIRHFLISLMIGTFLIDLKIIKIKETVLILSQARNLHSSFLRHKFLLTVPVTSFNVAWAYSEVSVLRKLTIAPISFLFFFAYVTLLICRHFVIENQRKLLRMS